MDTTSEINRIILNLEGVYKISDNLDKFKNYFDRAPEEEIRAYIQSFDKINWAIARFENIKIDLTELKKSILIYLGLHNFAHALNQKNNADAEELEATKYSFDLLTKLDQTNQENIKTGYLISGLSLIKSFHQENFSLPERIVIKDFHDRGGFNPTVWGVQINWPLLDKSIAKLGRLEQSEFEKEAARHKATTWETLLALSRL